MKNILKKLGVLGLITFILPFINVKAATTSCEGGELHLQNYLFLDVKTPDEFDEYYKTTNGIKGFSTYGNFPYTFKEPTDKTTVKIRSITPNNITTVNSLKQYWNLYNLVLSKAQLSNGLTSYLDEYLSGKYFTIDDSPNYKTNTIILHTTWSRVNQYGEEISNWPKFGYEEIPNTIQGSEKQQNAVNDDFINEMSVTIDGARYYNSDQSYKELINSVSGSYNNFSNLEKYFNDAINGNIVENTIWKNPNMGTNGASLIPLKITRAIDDDAYNEKIFGTNYKKDGQTVYQVFSMENENVDDTTTPDIDESAIIELNDVKKSYKAFLEYKKYESECESEADENACIYAKNTEKRYLYEIDSDDKDKIDFFRYEDYYWPFVLNVEYEVCPINNSENPSNPVPEKEWTLKYDANVEDVTAVTNLPKSQTAKISQEITVDSGKPTMKDYTFKKWCETKNGSGTCYNPGDKIKVTDATTVTLYAQWGPTTNVENPKQGVVSYIIGFAAVALIAGGIFLISKKKNLFKQI